MPENEKGKYRGVSKRTLDEKPKLLLTVASQCYNQQ